MDLSIRCNGVYSLRIVDPIPFYSNVTGNIEEPYLLQQLDFQLKSELLSALQPTLEQISAKGIRYSQIPAHTAEICEILDSLLSKSWGRLRGIDLISIGFNSITLPQEDEERIKAVQMTSVMRDTNMAAATLVGAQADAMKAAGANEGGAMLGFMGLGMAQTAGGNNAAQLYQMGKQPPTSQPPTTNTTTAPAQVGWSCNCGQTDNLGKFCMDCGQVKPEEPVKWQCSCSAQNSGKFCSECGSPKPSGTRSG
jgi:membrane protease subunit (stomatin/prohibitin family)